MKIRNCYCHYLAVHHCCWEQWNNRAFGIPNLSIFGCFCMKVLYSQVSIDLTSIRSSYSAFAFQRGAIKKNLQKLKIEIWDKFVYLGGRNFCERNFCGIKFRNFCPFLRNKIPLNTSKLIISTIFFYLFLSFLSFLTFTFAKLDYLNIFSSQNFFPLGTKDNMTPIALHILSVKFKYYDFKTYQERKELLRGSFFTILIFILLFQEFSERFVFRSFNE